MHCAPVNFLVLGTGFSSAASSSCARATQSLACLHSSACAPGDPVCPFASGVWPLPSPPPIDMWPLSAPQPSSEQASRAIASELFMLLSVAGGAPAASAENDI